MAIMTASPLVRTYTLEEFWELPDPTDRSKLELIAGVLYVSPPPKDIHDYDFDGVYRALRRHLDRNGIGGRLLSARAAIWTSPGTHLEPDLIYLSPESVARFTGKQRRSADLAVEILSPSTAAYDRSAKADTYGALGVRELWLVDRDSRTVEVRYQTGGGFGRRRVFQEDEEIVSEVFPNLRLRVAAVFEE